MFTYQRSKDPAKSIHSAVISNVVDVVAVDDHTVRIVLGAPQASFLTKTLERSSGRAMTIVSRGALEELGEAQYGLTPVGTGPFRVTGHQLGQSVVLERFDGYYDPERPKLDKVTIHADHRRRAARGGDRGGRHPADRRQPDRARDRRPLPRQPGSRGRASCPGRPSRASG